MRVLIYKRTHKGDPNSDGIFGHHDCMGRIRNWNYDAVIGIGGKSPWIEDIDIKHKINWVGLNPKKIKSKNQRGDKVVFGHFALFEGNGACIDEQYPNLFLYMYGSRKRFDMAKELPPKVFTEVKSILESIRDKPPSKKYYARNAHHSKTVRGIKCNPCQSKKRGKLTLCVC